MASRSRLPPLPRLLAEARRHWGVTAWRPGQEDLLRHLAEGRDVLGVLPTGAGKSLTFQLPALFLQGATVVVSPLLALMQDQQEGLAEAHVRSAQLSSALSDREARETHEAIGRGEHGLIYVTPEQLEKPERLALLRERGVSLLVVDEAHCVSQWGHDFRPAYLGLREARRALGDPQVLALTATATRAVERDVLEQLGVPDAAVVRTSIRRDNLFLEVARTVNRELKQAKLLEALREHGGAAAIVYCATVRRTDELHRWLASQGVAAARYHGQLRAREREETLTRFQSGEVPYVVATKAFGLGIDKPDIRLVVHYHFPDSLESYYQEAGRAGRDGEAARALLLYRLEDRRIQGFFLGGKYPRRDEVLGFWAALVERLGAGDARARAPLKQVAEAAGVPLKRAQVLAAYLAGAGVVQRGSRGLFGLAPYGSAEALGHVLDAYEERGRGDRERLEAMQRYGTTTECRWRLLHAWFDEPVEQDCGTCDNCHLRAAGQFDAPAAAAAGPA